MSKKVVSFQAAVTGIQWADDFVPFKGKRAAFFAELKANPGRWAVYLVVNGRFNCGGTPRLNRQYPEYEFRSQRTTETNARRIVFVRYVGSSDNTGGTHGA